jgi:hypothetical protein
VRLLQRLLEVMTIPIGGENFRRRPIVHVRNQGFAIEQQERFMGTGASRRSSALQVGPFSVGAAAGRHPCADLRPPPDRADWFR